jgi:arylsulfatase A-like enzyme
VLGALPDHRRARTERARAALGELFGTTSTSGSYDLALERTGLDRQRYSNVRPGLYDETMAHQDRELARFVERPKARGEREDTLPVIAADHGHPAGTFARFGRGLLEPQPEGWHGALFDAYGRRDPARSGAARATASPRVHPLSRVAHAGGNDAT